MKARRPRWSVTMLAAIAAVLVVAGSTSALPAANYTAPASIDLQVVQDQDDMTWDDYNPIPGIDWADPSHSASERTIRIAMVVADFDDQPFVITLPKHSDLFGNPQVDPVEREDVARFYLDFWSKPQAVNHGRTVSEYWMEQSQGKVGVEFDGYGPYRMPRNMVEYSGTVNVVRDPGQETGGQRARAGGRRGHSLTGDLDPMWRADAEEREYDLVLRIYAGYDETCVWQEFGEMKFSTKEDITPEWGHPDPTQPRWAPTRYVEWTSWKAGSYLWSNSAIINGESSGSIRHEIAHAAFRVGDNNNNPYVQPYRRAGSGPWDIMDRGSFNGPGGPHQRWPVPVTQGGAMPAGVMLRQRLNFGFISERQILQLNRNGLAESGLAVATVTARAVAPLPGTFAGITVRLDGDGDQTPEDDPATNPLSPGIPSYNFYSLEVVQRIGYDSFCPDSGVLIAKNKDREGRNGGPNGFNCFNWVIDANPQDINMVDFIRPNGEKVMRTIADYRQLNDALFHAGLNSGSQFEHVDKPNRLHFYVIDIHRNEQGILSYTLGVRSLDGSGPQQRGVALKAPADRQVQPGYTECVFTLENTGQAASTDPSLHVRDFNENLAFDIYRLSVAVEGEGWNAQLLNELAAVEFGASQPIPVYVQRTSDGAASARVTLKATSESDPSRTVTSGFVVNKH